jgi:hypothetical protein
MKSGIFGALAGLAALSAAPASAGGYWPGVYEARYDYGSTYVDTYVDGVGAGVVVHEKSYVGLNNDDPSIRYRTALDGCLYGRPRGCDRSTLTIDDRYRVAAARGSAPLDWSPTTYVPYAVATGPAPSARPHFRSVVPRTSAFVHRRTVERSGEPFRRYIVR